MSSSQLTFIFSEGLKPPTRHVYEYMYKTRCQGHAFNHRHLSFVEAYSPAAWSCWDFPRSWTRSKRTSKNLWTSWRMVWKSSPLARYPWWSWRQSGVEMFMTCLHQTGAGKRWFRTAFWWYTWKTPFSDTQPCHSQYFSLGETRQPWVEMTQPLCFAWHSSWLGLARAWLPWWFVSKCQAGPKKDGRMAYSKIGKVWVPGRNHPLAAGISESSRAGSRSIQQLLVPDAQDGWVQRNSFVLFLQESGATRPRLPWNVWGSWVEIKRWWTRCLQYIPDLVMTNMAHRNRWFTY